MYKYIFQKENNLIWSYLIDDETNRSIEIHCDQASPNSLKTGDMMIGRVESIVRNINAAFVKITPQQSAYLALEDLRDPYYTKKGSSKEIQQGDELIVQIKRESIKGKLPSVTTKLSLQGLFVSVETGSGVSVSKKLDKTVREQLRFAGQEIMKDEDLSLLFRTRAGEVKRQEVLQEAERMIGHMKNLLMKAQHQVCYSVLYRSVPKYLERLRRVEADQLLKIVAEDPDLHEEILSSLKQELPECAGKVQLYSDPSFRMSLLYSLEHRKQEALAAKVPLKSGGFLVISPTEALTAIDVNSGKNVVTSSLKTKEEMMLKANLEAAKEIAVQLRLRNISGIIIVDFINMETEESEKHLLHVFRELLKQDPVKTVLVDITKLGLVEVTRKKIEKPLWEMESGKNIE